MTTKTNARSFALSLSVAALVALQACSSPSIPGGEAKYPTGAQRSSTSGDIYAQPESIFGKDGLTLLGGNKDNAGEHVITVNSFLWRASLDTVSFMPIASVDPFGGAILTDWYSAPETPNERYKMNIFVLGSELRSDAIKVSVFKEKLNGREWKASKLDESMARKIEDTILTRARELRIAKVNSN
jgi:hypothetical protein